MPADPAPVHVRTYTHPDGWIYLYVDTDDLPARYRHATMLPKLALVVNGEGPEYLDPHGHFDQEPCT